MDAISRQEGERLLAELEANIDQLNSLIYKHSTQQDLAAAHYLRIVRDATATAAVEVHNLLKESK